MDQHRNVVLGLGNLLLADEGFGIHAIQALGQRQPSFSPPVELVDGGVLGLDLLPLVEETGRLLVLDAMDAAQPPGTLFELDREAIPLFSGIKLSQHQTSFQEVLGLAAVRGRLPGRLHVIAVQPLDLSLRSSLSPAVASVLPRALERVIQILADWDIKTAL